MRYQRVAGLCACISYKSLAAACPGMVLTLLMDA
jgi:hypothetical protein